MADIAAYQHAIRTCAAAREVLSGLDIPGLLRAIDHADALGPILDPTLYREKAKAMAEDKALLQAALPLATFKPGASRG